ncbi:MAG: hypothetical protein KC438_08145 [Thermomicrobiales bacterium]|nr:hypothetical protein [Thermomicrobiales bacterium]MCO5223506.1 hypothetical protein [Thermomicrobiales bacterium]
MRLPGTPINPEMAKTRSDVRRAAILTGAVGAVFAILFLLSLWLLHSTPKPVDSDESFIDFYSGDERQKIMLVGLYLLPFSAVAFIWFIAALRQWVTRGSRRGSQMIGTVQLLSGIGFITLALASAAASTMPAAMVELGYGSSDAGMARQFPLFGDALLLVFGVRMSAMFVMTTARIGRASGYMPRWFSIASMVAAAILFLSYSLTVWLAVVFPLWVLALGLLIIYHAYRADPESLGRMRAAGADPGDEP